MSATQHIAMVNIFKQRVKRRRNKALIFALGHFALLAVEITVLDILVLWVALDSLPIRLKWIFAGLSAVFVVWSYFIGWSAQRNFKGSIDNWLSESDKIEREVIAAAIQKSSDDE